MKRTLAGLILCSSLLMGTATSVAAQSFEMGLRAYDRRDYATALREWRPLAKRGNAAAQRNLGRMYNYGEGVVQNYKEAVKWYRVAAERGDAKAQYYLGWAYNYGEGIIQDYLMAHMWFNIGASNGNEGAARARDSIAKSMTAADISKAQELARECVARNYKGC